TGIATDRSGQGHNGSLAAMATSSSPAIGKLGQALKFNGVGNTVTIPNSAGVADNLQTMTISAWFKTTGTPGGNLIGKATAPLSDGWYLSLNTGNAELCFYLVSDLSDYNFVCTNNQYNDNTWHHVVATVNNGTPVDVYVDGVARGTGV